MKSFKILALAAFVIAAAACQGGKATVDCTVADAPSTALLLKQLNGTTPVTLDTVKTDAAGHFSYKVKVAEGNPEFVYVYNGDTRLASLLLEKGEKAVVEADTLGNYSVSGSAGSALLKEGDDAFRAYVGNLIALSEAGAAPSEIAKEYVRHYREAVRFVVVNNKSLAVIPVLYENIGGGTGTFSGASDALIFRSACDSLKTVYPNSKYVKGLEQEAQRRINLFELSNRMKTAEERVYPNVKMPSVNGTAAEIDSLDAKAILVYFWDDREATHKIFNLDVLKPVYEKYQARGLEIYAISVDPDKAAWAQVVKSQELPWINVNDGLGTASRSLYTFNVAAVPAMILLTDSGMDFISGEKQLRAKIEKALK
ncbi:MAG: DUF4369 domain-containing protein [Bacteroidales bacterium]|nr:DUF4369 domain-containing protein [Bacteroidales bacterium]